MTLLVTNSVMNTTRLLGRPLRLSRGAVSRLHQNKIDSASALNEAEKVVGYPTSFLNLRWLLSDEIANVGVHIRKLLGTKHPLLDTAKELLFRSEEASWGLVVLLVSKAAGTKKEVVATEQDNTAGILHSQRALAEVTEMIRTGTRLHKALLNYKNDAIDNPTDMNFGNKIALLTGDYLLSCSYHELACLRNQDLNELMSSALRDLVEFEFLGDSDEQNKPLPGKPSERREEIAVPDEFGTAPLDVRDVLGNARAEWTLRNVLGGGSLLAKSCQGAMLLAGHGEELQRKGYLFGKHLALAWHAAFELEQFKENKSGAFSLVSAPMLFHLQHDPELYADVEKGRGSVANVDYDKLRSLVVKGPGIEQTRVLQREHCENALKILDAFPVQDAQDALKNIIIGLRVV